MTHYVFIDRFTDTIWGDAEGDGAFDACPVVDSGYDMEECRYLETKHRENATLLVFELDEDASKKFRDYSDGYSAEDKELRALIDEIGTPAGYITRIN